MGRWFESIRAHHITDPLPRRPHNVRERCCAAWPWLNQFAWLTLFEGRRAISEFSELGAEAIVQLLTRGSHRSVADGVADRYDGGHPSRLVRAKTFFGGPSQ